MTTSTERPTRKGFTLSDAGREFWKHPSPWMIGAMLVAALTARIIVGDWQITDALVPLVMIALFPFFEWIIHVFILHWRPKHLGRLTIDPLLAREHRAHHVDPRSVPLIFIPTKSLLWVIPLTVAIAVSLQERALLVHGDELGHRRPCARHLPRSGDRRHLTDGEEPARGYC
jgi:hypothetical protein